MKHSEISASDNWIFFDSIFCISLKERNDRRDQARKEFAKVGLLERVEFLVVERHREDREQGIFESHMACLKRGLEQGSKHILIFEDDVYFQKYSSENIRNGCRSLSKTGKWDAFFLGAISSGSHSNPVKNIAKIRFRCLAHAYALNSSFAKQLIEIPWSGIPFDTLLKKRCQHSYALYPMCAYQGLFSSDNQTAFIDALRSLLGGLPFIQRSNELYQNNKVPFLIAPLLTFLGLLMLACFLR